MASQHKISIIVEGKDNGAGKMFGDLQKQSKELGKSLKDVGGVLTAGLTAPILAIGGAALKMSTDLNAAMANVAALGVPIERVNELKTAVQDLAIETGKSTDDLAGGLYQVISAFGDTADTVEILRTNAVLAAAGLATTEEAINLTSAVTKAYGDTSAEAVGHVADLALKTVELGQTTLPELAAAYGKVTALGNALGVSQEELAATFATTTGVTGNTAEVSTQMAATFQALLKPTAEMATAIGAIAEDLDAQGKLVGGPLVESWRGYGQTLAEERDELGQIATRMNALTRAGKEGSKEFKELSKRFKEQQKNVKDANKAYEKAAAALGPAIVEALGFGGSLEKIAEFADGNTDLLIKMFGSVEAGRLALGLGGALAEDYATKLEAMGDASGSLTKAFEAQTKGINAQGFSMQQLRSITQVLMQRLGDGLAPALGAVLKIVLPLADRALELATAFSKMDEKTQMWIVGILGAAAAIGPLLVAVGGIVSGFSTLLPVLAALTGPIGLVVAGLAALIALDVGGIRTVAAAVGEYAAAVWDAGFGSIEAKESIGLFPAVLQPAVSYMDDLAAATVNYAAAVWDAGFGSIEAQEAIGLFPESLQSVIGYLDNAVGGMRNLAGAIQDAGLFSIESQEALEDLIEKLTGSAEWGEKAANALAAMPGVLARMALWGAMVGTAFKSAKTELEELRNKITEQIDIPAITDKLKLAFGAVMTLDIRQVNLTGIKDSVVTAIQNIDWSDLADKGVTMFGALKAGIISALGSVNWSLTQFARGSGTTGGLAASIGKMRDGVIDAILSVEWGTIAAEKLGRLQTAITGLKDAAIDAILNVSWAPSPEQLSTLSGLLDGVGPVIEQTFETLNTISTGINEVIDAFSARLAGVDGAALGQQASAIAAGLVALAGVFVAANIDSISERVLSVVGLGNSILTFLTEFGQGIDAEAISGAIGGFVTGIVDTLASKLADPEIADLGTNIGAFVRTIITKIGEALSGNLGEDLGKSAGETVSGLATAALNIIAGLVTELGKVKWGEVGADILTFVQGFVTGVSGKIAEADFSPAAGGIVQAIGKALVEQFTTLPKIEVSFPGWDVVIPEWPTIEMSFNTTFSDAWDAWLSKLDWPTIEVPDWSTLLFWPTISVPDWSTLLYWPAISAPDWSSLLAWPDISWPGWDDFIKWPNITWPGWKDLLPWPKIPSFPGWTELLRSVIGGSGDAEANRYGANLANPHQASGTRFWRGGLTWVGEEGPELVNLPRGSQVFNSQRQMALAGVGAGDVVINNYVTVRDDLDTQILSDKIFRQAARRRP